MQEKLKRLHSFSYFSNALLGITAFANYFYAETIVAKMLTITTICIFTATEVMAISFHKRHKGEEVIVREKSMLTSIYVVHPFIIISLIMLLLVWAKSN